MKKPNRFEESAAAAAIGRGTPPAVEFKKLDPALRDAAERGDWEAYHAIRSAGAVVSEAEERGGEIGDRLFLKAARENGDWDALAGYLEWQCPVTPAMREFLAQVLRGKKRARGAPKTAETLTQEYEIGGFLEDQKRQRVRNPIAQALKFFGVSRSTVQAAKRKWKKYEPALQDFILMARGWERHRKGCK